MTKFHETVLTFGGVLCPEKLKVTEIDAINDTIVITVDLIR